MAVYPESEWRPLTPENVTQPLMPHPRLVIVHTAVDSRAASSLWPYFERGTDLESHFFTGWSRAEQYVDTGRTADANFKANRFAISVETEDDGDPSIPWNDFQLGWIIDFCRWANVTHGIPLTAATAWDGSGIGYHSQFPMIWTPYKGKTCPGPVRIRQLQTIILPALAAGPSPAPAPASPISKDDDMNVRFIAKLSDPGVLFYGPTNNAWKRHVDGATLPALAATLNNDPDITVVPPPTDTPDPVVVTNGGYTPGWLAWPIEDAFFDQIPLG